MIASEILFHPRKGLFLSAMTEGQQGRWRRHHGFVIVSWRYRPSDDETLSLLQYLSINLQGHNDWAKIFEDLAKTLNKTQFKRALRQTSRELKQGQPIEKAVQNVLPARLATAILSTYKRGRVSQEIEKIFENHLRQVEEQNKRAAKKLYPITLVFGLLSLVIMVDIQFVPVLRSLFSSYGISPPAIMALFSIGVQMGGVVGLLLVIGVLGLIYKRLPFSVKASIPLVGQLRAIELNAILLDAYQESLLRECSYDGVLQERFELQKDRFLQYGISTVLGRLRQGLDLKNSMKEIPRVQGWGGAWTNFVVGNASERIFHGISAYQRRFNQHEAQIKDTMQTSFVGALIVLVATVIAILGYLMVLPLQYADRLI